jgi:hypothetical protein
MKSIVLESEEQEVILVDKNGVYQETGQNEQDEPDKLDCNQLPLGGTPDEGAEQNDSNLDGSDSGSKCSNGSAMLHEHLIDFSDFDEHNDMNWSVNLDTDSESSSSTFFISSPPGGVSYSGHQKMLAIQSRMLRW